MDQGTTSISGLTLPPPMVVVMNDCLFNLA
jgi:hypothetical protein